MASNQNYASLFTDFSPVAPKAKSTPKKTRKTKTREVIHPIFVTYASKTDDSFWSEVIQDIAYGKFPKKTFYYRDGVIGHKKGAKDVQVELAANNIEATSQIIAFFRSYGVFSPEDEENAHQTRLQRRVEEAPPLIWKDQNANMRECLIDSFVQNLQEQFELSRAEKVKLAALLKKGITERYFHDGNIALSANSILEFRGLLWDDETREFSIDPMLQPLPVKSYSKKAPVYQEFIGKECIPRFNEDWAKFCVTFNKACEKNLRRGARQAAQEANAEAGDDLTNTTDVVSTDATERTND